jgi:UPF0755 protein
MKSTYRYLLVLLFAGGVLVAGLLAHRMYHAVYGENDPRQRGEFAEISITKGMSVHTVGRLLQEKGLIKSAKEFVFAARILRLDDKIQAGVFPLPYGKSNAELLARLINAGTSAALVTIPEGSTSCEIAHILQTKIGMDSTEFMKAVFDTSLLQQFGIEAPSFEGYLFPDSYNLYREMRPSWVIRKMTERFFSVFDSTRRAKAVALGMTVNQIVTIASIIEGEMVYNSEATEISAVYHNRLKKNMLLQADPTIQYIIPSGPRRLFRSDLTIESPYNTYLHPGLPPGAVCNPGRVALDAALHPAAVPYIFLVSRGDGWHAFNTTLDAHLEDKAHLDSLRQAAETATNLSDTSLQQTPHP